MNNEVVFDYRQDVAQRRQRTLDVVESGAVHICGNLCRELADKAERGALTIADVEMLRAKLIDISDTIAEARNNVADWNRIIGRMGESAPEVCNECK